MLLTAQGPASLDIPDLPTPLASLPNGKYRHGWYCLIREARCELNSHW